MLLAGLLTAATPAASASTSTSTSTSSAVTTTVNDSAISSTAGFAYSGTWRTVTGNAAKHMGDDHYSYTKGSSSTFRFTGTSLRLYGAKAPHHGHASISIDGGAPVTVDTYASTRTENALLFTSPELAAGPHTVEVTVTGTKRSGSTGTSIALDRAVSSAPAAATLTTVNDSAISSTAGFAYSGTWRTVTGNAAKYMGDDHYSYTKGSSSTFRFTGTSLRLYGAKAPHHGHASISIDGGAPVTVDTYARTRTENALLFTSPELAAGPHTVKVTVRGTKRSAALGRSIAIDRAVTSAPTQPAAVVTTEPAPVVATEPAPVVTAEPAPVVATEPAPVVATEPAPVVATEPAPVVATGPTSRVVLDETGDGADLRPYAASTLNGTHPTWYVEGGSAPVNRIGGAITKVDSKQFHRVFSTKRLGGPGKTLKISYRGRATSMYNRAGSSIVEGAKIGLKFPQAQALTGYSKEDPRSVIGSTTSAASPGSYQFLTGITENGYVELARNPYGTGKYKFWPNTRGGYTPGTWKDITVTVEWVDATTVRVRYWHNATGAGAPVYEAIDTSSPFATEPGFLWLRSDDTNFEYDFIKVEELEAH